ncbi:uncharacterized protein AC631_05424 [Debaryomyces fabryi]|uniref:PH domain-containing protein n=1 Tax=Debaryomyces fabryi TaxID=58627 RepID=A0A0V1PRF0_9ASCO|nr:uncharacterized protein AC631_05424 [Debaryomyces fabryi]KRZ98813.1 hypothetical protein AC631_05424 [Debaryomyces fabryi]CUM46715.1 unnamed protein product [Debaryomyces fabryi]
MALPYQDDIVNIPKSSFTAFRLTYQSPKHLSDTSKCILLGSVPNLYLLDNKLGFFTGAANHAKNKVKKRFKIAVGTVNKSIRSSSGYRVNNNQGEGPDGGFNLFFRNDKRENINEIINEIAREHELETEEMRNSNYKPDDDMDIPSGNFDTSGGSSESSLDYYDPANEVSSPVKSFFYPAKFDMKSQDGNGHFSGFNTQNLEMDDIMDLQVLENSDARRESIILAEESTIVFNTPVDEEISKLGVTFDPSITTRATSRRKKVEIAIPAPYEMNPEDLLKAEKENHRFRKKFKHFAKGSRKVAKSKGNDLRLKIYSNIWKSYEVGEIMRMDKMLVLIKHAYHVNNVTGFGENEPCDSRVYERWKEYIVVLRKAENMEAPLIVQLYDISATTSDTKTKPEFSFKLNFRVKSRFYSGVDKSISLCVPKENGAMIYIMKPSNQFTSFRWLHFVSQFIRHNFDRSFYVSIPGLKLSLMLRVPESEIIKLVQRDNILEVRRLQKGYKIEYSNLIQYLKEAVLKELEKKKHMPEVADWLLKNFDPWFCFKQYDRLEWIVNNSGIFFIQNQLLSRSFQLEFRNKAHHERYTRTEQGKLMTEPVPIEGFLSRLTNNYGSERSMWKTFHKISYFYSADDILFFTKFFRGMPPSPNNALLKDNTEGILDKLPPVYEHNPFPIDSNEHISWLNKDDFELHDQNAIQELERRAQQIIKAEALIDICLIVDVRAIPVQRSRKAQNLLLCLLWYSAPDLVHDNSIVDSLFEIEMQNGSIIKLQAPSRLVRDEWVTRLVELRDYWVSRRLNDLNSLICTRLQNERDLKINEYVDSNIIQENDIMGPRNSHADPNMYNINCIAMTNCVLMSGYLYQKLKKHSNFNQYYIVLCPGFLVLFTLYKRSKRTGSWKQTPYFQHYLTIPISDCYVYSGQTTALDLLTDEQEFHAGNPGHHSLPRIYSDGWKSSEEEPVRCFTLWFGKKRGFVGKDRAAAKYNNTKEDESRVSCEKNPGLIRMIKKLGVTGKSIVFMARSRQEREVWVQRIATEIDRFAKNE